MRGGSGNSTSSEYIELSFDPATSIRSKKLKSATAKKAGNTSKLDHGSQSAKAKDLSNGVTKVELVSTVRPEKKGRKKTEKSEKKAEANPSDAIAPSDQIQPAFCGVSSSFGDFFNCYLPKTSSAADTDMILNSPEAEITSTPAESTSTSAENTLTPADEETNSGILVPSDQIQPGFCGVFNCYPAKTSSAADTDMILNTPQAENTSTPAENTSTPADKETNLGIFNSKTFSAQESEEVPKTPEADHTSAPNDKETNSGIFSSYILYTFTGQSDAVSKTPEAENPSTPNDKETNLTTALSDIRATGGEIQRSPTFKEMLDIIHRLGSGSFPVESATGPSNGAPSNSASNYSGLACGEGEMTTLEVSLEDQSEEEKTEKEDDSARPGRSPRSRDATSPVRSRSRGRSPKKSNYVSKQEARKALDLPQLETTKVSPPSRKVSVVQFEKDENSGSAGTEKGSSTSESSTPEGKPKRGIPDEQRGETRDEKSITDSVRQHSPQCTHCKHCTQTIKATNSNRTEKSKKKSPEKNASEKKAPEKKSRVTAVLDSLTPSKIDRSAVPLQQKKKKAEPPVTKIYKPPVLTKPKKQHHHRHKSPVKARATSPAKARATSPAKARAGSPVKTRATAGASFATSFDTSPVKARPTAGNAFTASFEV